MYQRFHHTSARFRVVVYNARHSCHSCGSKPLDCMTSSHTGVEFELAVYTAHSTLVPYHKVLNLKQGRLRYLHPIFIYIRVFVCP